MNSDAAREKYIDGHTTVSAFTTPPFGTMMIPLRM
jgi:hypothetical protein